MPQEVHEKLRNRVYHEHSLSVSCYLYYKHYVGDAAGDKLPRDCVCVDPYSDFLSKPSDNHQQETQHTELDQETGEVTPHLCVGGRTGVRYARD